MFVCLLRTAPWITLALFIGPILAGLAGTLLPAFGFLPALGGDRFSLQPWQDLLAAPGLRAASLTALFSGLTAALCAFLLASFCLALASARPRLGWLRRLQSPLLAVPHLALAIGLAFILAPSGWLARMLSPWLTGWQRPPDLLTVQDPLALALTLGLVLKETPFLLLMMYAVARQLGLDRQVRAARLMGYGPVTAWLKVAWPQIYAQVRLPLFAVIAYGVSNVDMAIPLGPSAPPTLSVLLWRWFTDPDLAFRFQAAAGAMLQALLVVIAIALWWLGERLLARLARSWLSAGDRRRFDGISAAFALALVLAGVVLSWLALGSLAVWAGAGPWRFPAALPQSWSISQALAQDGDIGPALWTSLGIGLASTALCLGLCVLCLENEAQRGKRAGGGSLLILYIPLLVPQIAFLFGLQVAFGALGIAGTALAVIIAHCVFVVPYVFLALSEPYRRLDPRYAQLAATLAKSPLRVFAQIKLPILLRPILIAAALGFSVSMAQYLATLFAGAGRIETLTTEALTLMAGGNRRLVSTLAFVLAILPFIGFSVARLIPAWCFRNRRDLAAVTSGQGAA